MPQVMRWGLKYATQVHISKPKYGRKKQNGIAAKIMPRTMMSRILLDLTRHGLASRRFGAGGAGLVWGGRRGADWQMRKSIAGLRLFVAQEKLIHLEGVEA